MFTCTTKVKTTAVYVCVNKVKSGARLSLSVKRAGYIPKTGNVMTVILHVQDNNKINISPLKLNLD